MVKIHGGSSGIGTFAIQIAKYLGIKVFVTAGSEEKLVACKVLGADVCINYRTEDFVERIKQETNGKGVDVILDNIGGSYLQRNLNSLGVDGRLFIIGFQGGIAAEVNLQAVLACRLTIQAAGLRNRSLANKAEIVSEVEKNVWPAVAAGKVKPVIYKTFPLCEAAEAHRLMEASTHIGKILLLPLHLWHHVGTFVAVVWRIARGSALGIEVVANRVRAFAATVDFAELSRHGWRRAGGLWRSRRACGAGERFARRDSPRALREGIRDGRVGGHAGGVCRGICGGRITTGGWRRAGVAAGMGRAGRAGGSSGVIRRGRCGREFAVGGQAVVRVGFAAVRGGRIVANGWRRARVAAGVRGGQAVRTA
eukprot:XP_020407875.1 uncharacterized protein LOC103655800 [Zea mays]